MNILDRYYVKLEKNKKANKALKQKAYERYLLKARRLNEQNEVYRKYTKARKQAQTNSL